MKRLLALLMFPMLMTWMAFAQDGSRVCSVATLHGTYGFAISGTRPVPAQPITESVVGTATTEFDGSGNFTQTDNVHGSVTGYTPNRTGTGTYTLNADCSGTMTLQNEGVPFSLLLSITVVDDGKEVRAAVVDITPRAPNAPIPPIMVASVGKRI